MGTITALRKGRSRKSISVFIDGSSSLIIDGETAVKAGLQVGQYLSLEQVEEIMQVNLHVQCLEVALRYLSYRPRSELEVRQRLSRRGFSNGVIGDVIIELKQSKLVDDVAFAEYWKDNRLSFRPRSRGLIKYELMQKGIDTETANEAIEGLDDENSAYEVGLKKVRVLDNIDYDGFHKYLSGYFRRRGYSYEVINPVVMRLWQERQAASV